MNQSVSAGCCSPPCSLHTPHHHPPSEGQGVCQGRTLPLARTLYTLQTIADLSWLFFSTSVHFCVDIQNYVKHHFFVKALYISTFLPSSWWVCVAAVGSAWIIFNSTFPRQASISILNLSASPLSFHSGDCARLNLIQNFRLQTLSNSCV